MSSFSIHNWLLTGPVCAGTVQIITLAVTLMIAMTVQCPEGVILSPCSPPIMSYNLSALYYSIFPEPRVVSINVLFMTEHSNVQYP